MKSYSWKTTLAGILGGLFLLFGPRLQGDPKAPPVTLGSVTQAVAVAALGYLAKDSDKT